MTQSAFESLLAEIAATIADRPAGLRAPNLPQHGVPRRRRGRRADRGALCGGREAGGIAFGRVIVPGGRPGASPSTWSAWPTWSARTTATPDSRSGGEIDLILPLEGAPAFDGVTGGAAHGLSLLPEGEIAFTGA